MYRNAVVPLVAYVYAERERERRSLCKQDDYVLQYSAVQTRRRRRRRRNKKMSEGAKKAAIKWSRQHTEDDSTL